MSNALMTPDTAPRDAGALASQGPFIHRRLGEQLEQLGFRCWTNEREKTAFVTATPQDRAQALLTQLQAYDQTRGGAPPPQAPPPAQTAPQAPPAAPQAAPAPTTTRQPRNSATANGAAGGASPAMGATVDLLNAIKALQGDLQKAVAASEKASSSVDEVQALKGMVAASMKVSEIHLGLLCLIAQNVLGAPTEDILQTAITDGAAALATLEELTGKG